jgi:hypothetical protein
VYSGPPAAVLPPFQPVRAAIHYELYDGFKHDTPLPPRLHSPIPAFRLRLTVYFGPPDEVLPPLQSVRAAIHYEMYDGFKHDTALTPRPQPPTPAFRLRLTVYFGPPAGVLPPFQSVRAAIHYEMYDGLPLLRKWIELWRLGEGQSEVTPLDVHTNPRGSAVAGEGAGRAARPDGGWAEAALGSEGEAWRGSAAEAVLSRPQVEGGASDRARNSHPAPPAENSDLPPAGNSDRAPSARNGAGWPPAWEGNIEHGVDTKMLRALSLATGKGDVKTEELSRASNFSSPAEGHHEAGVENEALDAPNLTPGVDDHAADVEIESTRLRAPDLSTPNLDSKDEKAVLQAPGLLPSREAGAAFGDNAANVEVESLEYEMLRAPNLAPEHMTIITQHANNPLPMDDQVSFRPHTPPRIITLPPSSTSAAPQSPLHSSF